MTHLHRRSFIILLGGAAAWPRGARAQQDGRVRRVGILERGFQSDHVTQIQQGALREGLAKQGWIEGRNVRFDVRYAEDDPDRMRAHADELVRLGPEVIVAGSRPVTFAVMQRTRTIPIVFTNVGDPLDGGLVKNFEPEKADRTANPPEERKEEISIIKSICYERISDGVARIVGQICWTLISANCALAWQAVGAGRVLIFGNLITNSMAGAGFSLLFLGGHSCGTRSPYTRSCV